MRKRKNDNEDGGGFFKRLSNVLKHLEPIDVVLEHPFFIAHLRRICAALTFNWADAEDLFNEVCLKLTLKIDQFNPSKPNASFVGWLRTMARNVFFDGHRPRKLEIDRSKPSDERRDLRYGGADAFEQLWRRELNKELKKLIADQDDPERLMLTYFFQGFSYREIAKKLDTEHKIPTTHVTVRNVVRKLLQKFWKSNVSISDVERKASKVSRPPVVKAEVKRKTEKVSKRKSSTRRPALKK